MKKIIIICITIFLISISVSLKGQSDYQFKDDYDRLYSHYTTGDYDKDIEYWYLIWGNTLSSLITMYEATGDVCYLLKFAEHTHALILKQNSSYYWDLPSDYMMMYTGVLLKPMAEFIYLVRQSIDSENDIYRTNIPSGTFPNNEIDNRTILGYGDFANWLITRVEPALDRMISTYWINDSKCFAKVEDYDWWEFKSRRSAEINMIAPYASSMYLLGLLNNNHNGYLNKAEAIGWHFKNLLIKYDPNNSYTWFHNEYQEASLYREDVAHALPDIEIALLFNQFNPSIFSGDDLVKFARTFTYNIWDRAGVEGFRNNVYGMKIDNDPAQQFCNGFVKVNETFNFYSPGEVLGWIILCEYDDMTTYPNDIYSVITTHAKKLLQNSAIYLPDNYCYDSTINLSGPLSFWGLSEIIKAQRKLESLDFILSKRNLVYNQNFEAKGMLIVDPSIPDPSNGSLYYNPPVANEFIINNAIKCNMKSSKGIILKEGFIASQGCEFTASIDLSLSEQQLKSSMNSISESVEINQTTEIEEEVEIEEVLNIYPNPFTSSINISFQLTAQSDVRVEILDILGNKAISDVSFNKVSNVYYNIGTSNLNNGMYICRIWVNNILLKKEKIVKLE